MSQSPHILAASSHAPTRWALSAVTAALLTACGGGGGASFDSGSATTALSLSGSAASGAAIASGKVEFKCAGGSGSATTLADGSFGASIAGGVLPCVARVTAADGTVLHSLALGSGSSARVDMTPATQLIVARVAGSDPASYYAAFDANAAAGLSNAAVASAQTAVVAELKVGGVDLSGAGDLIAGPLKPKSGSTAGDAYDQALDAFAAALSIAGSTLAAVTNAIVATSDAVTTQPSAPSSTPSLPAAMLLRPAAAGCPSLRSGTYRVVSPDPRGDLGTQFGLAVFDAASLTFRGQDGSTNVLTLVEPCHYTTSSGKSDLVVSAAGIIVARSVNNDGSHSLSVAFPEQSHSLAELAGSWNLLGMQKNDPGGFTGIAGSYSVDAAGILSAGSVVNWCQNDASWSIKGTDCVAKTGSFGSPPIANPFGGFDVADADGAVHSHAYAYRSGNGDLMLVKVDGNGSFQFRTKQRVNVLPTVGAVSNAWNVFLASSLFSTIANNTGSNKILSTDVATQSWLRAQKNNGGNGDHPETLFANNPRNGYSLRPSGAAVDSNGATVSFGEFTSLGLRGMGLTPLLLPAPKLFLLSVLQP